MGVDWNDYWNFSFDVLIVESRKKLSLASSFCQNSYFVSRFQVAPPFHLSRELTSITILRIQIEISVINN